MRPLDRLDPFDRRLYAGLADLAQPRVPTYLDEVLALTVRTRQRRGWIVAGRPVAISRVLALAATVGALLALLAFLLFGPGRPSLVTQQPHVSPTPGQTLASHAPSANPVPSPSAGLVPSALQGDWIGRHRDLTSVGINGGQALLQIGAASTEFLADWDTPSLASEVIAETGSPDSGSITVETTAGSGVDGHGCDAGSMGSYEWNLVDRRHLTLAARSDQCAARRLAFSGDWESPHCTGDLYHDCLGALDPGTWFTGAFEPIDPAQHPRMSSAELAAGFPGITYHVPSGWSAPLDQPDSYVLEPGSGVAFQSNGGWLPDYYGIYLAGGPTLDTNGCSGKPDPTFDARPRPSYGHDLVSRIRAFPGIVATNLQDPISIGGMTGASIDLHLAPTYSETCPIPTGYPSRPTFSFLTDHRTDAWPTQYFPLQSSGKMRLYVLEGPTVGYTVAVAIYDARGTKFDELLPEATPIVQSFDVRAGAAR